MKKGITLIAVLAAVLAVTSGAFAAANHYLITRPARSRTAPSRPPISRRPRATRCRARRATPALPVGRGLAGAQGLKGDTGATGAQGPKGDTGATGAQGPKGSAATSGYEVRTWRYSKDDANSDAGPDYVGVGSGAIATVACSPGKVALEWRLPVHVGR